MTGELNAGLLGLFERQAIKRVIADYFDAVERRNWDRVTATFAPDAYVDYGTPGVDDVERNVALLRAGVDRLTSASTLLGMQGTIAVTGETGASTTWAFTAHCPAGADPGPARMSIVRYEDTWRRSADGGWRITRRVAHHELKGWLTMR
jgi:ketosteroid isomerase-like protein